MTPPITGLHIEPTNICTLKCAGCARTRFINQWPQHWQNYNLGIHDLMQFLDVDLTGLDIHFCGNYGDPIYHPNFIEMVSAVKQKGAIVYITTNGSYKKPEWWQHLCGVLSEQDCIRFSIDGSPSNFTDYRVNADWESIKNGIEICADHSVQTIWKYIPFKFNRSNIETARALSVEMGMDGFIVGPSDRYDEHTQHLMPSSELVASRYRARGLSAGSIDPKCHRGKEHFITATGHYSPCCYVADHRFYYKTDFGKNKNVYDITATTFSQILDRGSVIEFFDGLSSLPPAVCQFNCPKI